MYVMELKTFFSKYKRSRAVVEACPVWEVVDEAGRRAGVEERDARSR
jgi:hypothetical protein